MLGRWKIMISNKNRKKVRCSGKFLLKNDKGMMTVEISVLLPFILILLTGMLFFLFFLQDMSAAKSEVMLLANEAAAVCKTGGNLVTGEYGTEELKKRRVNFLTSEVGSAIKKQGESRMLRRMKARMCVTAIKKYRMETGKHMIRAKAELVFRLPITGKQTKIKGWTFSCAVKAPGNNREEWMRMSD